MTTMRMPPMPGSWDRVQSVISNMGLTVVLRTKRRDRWVIRFAEDLTAPQKSQLEDRIVHIVSGVDWA